MRGQDGICKGEQLPAGLFLAESSSYRLSLAGAQLQGDACMDGMVLAAVFLLKLPLLC